LGENITGGHGLPTSWVGESELFGSGLRWGDLRACVAFSHLRGHTCQSGNHPWLEL